MELKDCRIDGSTHFKIDEHPTCMHMDKALKADYVARTEANNQRMSELQDKLYAEGREGVVILLQAMDAAGKDSTIKHVMSGVNPQGVDVFSFKQPSTEELAHGYLWRASRELPRRGKIALYNRSYYEDVLVVRVHDLRKGYSMPDRCLDLPEKELFDHRFDQIRSFEEYLYDNGYRVLKIFLNVGLEEQKRRFLARIDDESKNWKFSSSDLKERARWPQYMQAYEDAINGTSTKHSPWFCIPADQKWFARWLVSEAVVDVLEECDPHYPKLPKEQREQLASYKSELMGTAEEDGPTEGTE
ncbi:MAG: polyphosphate kinase 2 family protein [Atopobiaceae bacterium]|nr:polyphosphate kinase 2 family protein [Atopobiaceae bacterium]